MLLCALCEVNFDFFAYYICSYPIPQLKKEAEDKGGKSQQQERREKMRSKHMTLKQKMAAKAGTGEEVDAGRGRADAARAGRGAAPQARSGGGASSNKRSTSDANSKSRGTDRDSSKRASSRSGGKSGRSTSSR
jgi:hypothetical protein